jgi:predicted MFS family arabinose efflux permease
VKKSELRFFGEKSGWRLSFLSLSSFVRLLLHMVLKNSKKNKRKFSSLTHKLSLSLASSHQRLHIIIIIIIIIITTEKNALNHTEKERE